LTPASGAGLWVKKKGTNAWFSHRRGKETAHPKGVFDPYLPTTSSTIRTAGKKEKEGSTNVTSRYFQKKKNSEGGETRPRKISAKARHAVKITRNGASVKREKKKGKNPSPRKKKGKSPANLPEGEKHRELSNLQGGGRRPVDRPKTKQNQKGGLGGMA